MITIDNITIIVSAIVVAIALITPWINIFARKPKMKDDEYTNEDTNENDDDNASEESLFPKVSIILTPHENAKELNDNLPLFLNQDYPAGFQVIVVTWKGDSESDDVLKRFASDPHLYTTYIPDSSRYMSRKKLAITVGVKAAKNEWLLMTDITSTPDSNQWLKTMARNCTDGISLVAGYTRYEDSTSDYRQFERFMTDCYIMREIQHNHAYRCNSTCLMFRKSEFIREEGFRGNLKYLRGEYDFMVNKYAQPMGVALENSPEAWMTEMEPTNKEWRNKRLFYMADRKHLHGSSRHRIPIIVDQLALHINYIAIIAAAAFGIITQNMIIMLAAALALIITIIIRTVLASRAFKQWAVDIPAWKTIFFEISVLWRQIIYRIEYSRSDKNDFISHKI